MLPWQAIFNTCGVWVYILSVLFLKEALDLRKILSLVIGPWLMPCRPLRDVAAVHLLNFCC